MYFYHSKLYFFVIPMVLALLNACTTGSYYAPVKTTNNESAGDKQKLLISKQRLNKSSPVVTSEMSTYQTVPNQRTYHAMDLSSSHGYQPKTSWNHKSPPNKMTAGMKIKHPEPEKKVSDNKQQNTAGTNTSAPQSKTIRSVTNKSTSEDRAAHKKQPTDSGLAQQPKSQQKKSIVSIDNKKMLELNFGWPIKGRVLNSFSPSHNKGIDVAGKNGQQVKATEAGKVVYGGQGLIGFGKLLIIKHNDVYLSAYANNSRLLVNEGQHVQKGQVVAMIGDVGIKRTSLHFEIRENGKPVNPLKLLPKK
jgi:lipoprotein NlpD